MKIKIPVIITSVVLFATASFAQLQPNSTNPDSLQLRFSTYIPEESGYWYQYFEWKAATDNELYLNSWSLDGSTVGNQSTPLVIKVKGYSDRLTDNILMFEGKIEAEEIEVKNLNLPDYVFKSDYILRPLGEVEAFINANQHLPGVPSAAEVMENGMNVTQMTNVMLGKIEELTLYIIELKKENEAMRQQMNQLLQ